MVKNYDRPDTHADWSWVGCHSLKIRARVRFTSKMLLESAHTSASLVTESRLKEHILLHSMSQLHENSLDVKLYLADSMANAKLKPGLLPPSIKIGVAYHLIVYQ
ncbi:hypothetical protein K501DRAFT_279238 [Backusella circina FSU 941]|nr:hypothetical protein K501DRAFT_279238 [Backusella circina FSU 941]